MKKSLLPQIVWKYLNRLEEKTVRELEKIWALITDHDALMIFLFYVIGVLLTPITLTCVLWGYRRSYERIWQEKLLPPALHPLPKSFKVTMFMCGLLPVGIFAAIVSTIMLFGGLSYTISTLFGGTPSERTQTELRDNYNQLRIEKDSLFQLSLDPNYYKTTRSIYAYNPSKHAYETKPHVVLNPIDPSKYYSLPYAQKDSFNRVINAQKKIYLEASNSVKKKMDSVQTHNEAYPLAFWDSGKFLKRSKKVNGKYELDDGPVISENADKLISQHKTEVTLLGLILAIGLIWWYFSFNLTGTTLLIIRFNLWRSGLQNLVAENARHGTARFAYPDELTSYNNKKGFYIGGNLSYSKQGHLLTVSGTRGGKFVNLISQNLLGAGGYDGSWVIIDPKGETAAVTARYQKEAGKKVVILNPWGALGLQQDSFNPLDILLDDNNPNLVDDAKMIAEMIVPMKNGDRDSYFNDRARGIISALITHLCTAPAYKDERNLTTIWRWMRGTQEQWSDLTREMAQNDHKTFGHIVNVAGLELDSFFTGNERESSSVISSGQRWTDFLNSPAMASSMKKSSFNAKDLTNGNTTIYVVIPAERIPTHSQWLRLITGCLMRYAIREPNKRVTFMLDEFFALGYMSEIEVALGAYAGYNVSLWLILQNLTQLKNLYGDNWENFIGSCAVRHFFNMSDRFSAEYVSNLMGQKSVPTFNKGARGVIAAIQGLQITGSSPRALVTADEFRRSSDTIIYTMIDQLPVTTVNKHPYFEMPELDGRYDPNPYYKG